MGTKIIKQDDGKFGLFSTISDRIWAFDCDEAEMIRIWRERAAERAEKEMKEWLADVQGKGRGPKAESMTLKGALRSHQFIDPKLAEKDPAYQPEVDLDVELKKLKAQLKGA